LELRPPVLDDARALFDAYASDPRVARYMDWRPVANASVMSQRLAVLIADMADGKRWDWVIRKLDEAVLCGKIELRVSGREAEVGYMLAASHWGEGLMSEALAAVLEFARERLSLSRVSGTCDPENRASARVFQKCGFRYVGRREASLVRPNLSGDPRASDCYEIALARRSKS
jgi:ribosomal-protein-alanine N-acetyltransferase